MKTYSFKTTLIRIDHALMKYILIIPQEILTRLPGKSRIRVNGTINKAPFTLSILSLKDGRKYFAASTDLRKRAGLTAGSEAFISFHLIDENIIEIPEAFKEALLQDEEGAAIFTNLMPGLQRSLMHYIISAKGIDTQIRRSLYLLEKIKRGELEVQKKQRS